MKIRIRGTETFKVEKMFEPITLTQSSSNSS